MRADDITIKVEGNDVVVEHYRFGFLAQLKPHAGRVFTKDLSDMVEVYGESFSQWAERVKKVWGVEVGEEFLPKWSSGFKEPKSSSPTLTSSLGDAFKRAGLVPKD